MQLTGSAPPFTGPGTRAARPARKVRGADILMNPRKSIFPVSPRLLIVCGGALPNLKDDQASLRIDQTARAGGGRRGLWITAVIALIVVAVAGWAWSTRVDAIAVHTTAVKAESGGPAAGAVLNASGYVTARRRATVSSKVTGKVLEVFVEEGKAVRRGQVLARLDASQVRAALGGAAQQRRAAARCRAV